VGETYYGSNHDAMASSHSLPFSRGSEMCEFLEVFFQLLPYLERHPGTPGHWGVAPGSRQVIVCDRQIELFC